MSPSKRSPLLQTILFISTLVGGATGLSSLLLGFGFFSQSALFGYTGLPFLSVDYNGLIEAGATALVKSLSVLFESTGRKAGIFLILGGTLGLWLFHRHFAWMKRLFARPIACLVAYVGLVILLLATLAGLIRVARLADAKERPVLLREVQDAVREVRKAEAWNPIREDEVVMRHTYPTAGPLFWATGKLAFKSRTANDFLTRQSERAVTTGYPLRRSPVDRDNARTLFGWAFFWVLSLGFGLGLTWRWHGLLREQPVLAEPVAEDSSATPPELRRLGDHPREAMQLMQWLLQPLSIACLLLSLSLLPIAYGILVHSVIGEEKVVVQLNHSERCINTVRSLEGNEKNTAPTSHSDDRHGSEKSGDPAALLTKLLQAAKERERPKLRSQDPLRICGREEASRLEKLSEGVTIALRHLLHSHRQTASNEKLAVPYQTAIDSLAAETERTGCLQGLQLLEQLKPSGYVFRTFPVAAHHYLARWMDTQRHFARSRAGYILRSPRSSGGSPLTLFEPLVEPSPLVSPRWLVHVVPNECIADLQVEPDLIGDAVDRTLQQYDGTQDRQSALAPMLNTLHPKALRAMLSLLQQEQVALPHRGILVTALGTVASALRDVEPEAAMLAVDQLHKLWADPQQPANHRGSAATSLHLIGGAYAAHGLAQALHTAGDIAALPSDVLGPTVTTMGYLLADLQRWHTDLGESREPPHSAMLQTAEKTLRGLLLDLLDQRQRLSQELVGSVATSLGHARFDGADRALLPVLADAFKQRRWVALGPTITAMGFLGSRLAQSTLWRIVEGADIPLDIRGGGLTALYSIGLYDQSEHIFRLLLNPGTPAELKFIAANFIDDLSRIDAGRLALACAHDPQRPPIDRHACIVLMSVLPMMEDGDDGLAAELETLRTQAETPASLSRQICYTLAEFRLRGGHQAARVFGLGKSHPCQENLAELQKHDLNESRREFHLLMRLPEVLRIDLSQLSQLSDVSARSDEPEERMLPGLSNGPAQKTE